MIWTNRKRAVNEYSTFHYAICSSLQDEERNQRITSHLFSRCFSSHWLALVTLCHLSFHLGKYICKQTWNIFHLFTLHHLSFFLSFFVRFIFSWSPDCPSLHQWISWLLFCYVFFLSPLSFFFSFTHFQGATSFVTTFYGLTEWVSYTNDLLRWFFRLL